MKEEETETQPALKMTFIPTQPEFAAGAQDYEKIWAEDGERIVQVITEVTGLLPRDTEITANVNNKVPYSGYPGVPMNLRHINRDIKNDWIIKQGTLIHELGHRFLGGIGRNQSQLDPHQILDLVLYEIFEKLYGEEFAQFQIKHEKGLKGGGAYDYEGTWNWALAMTPEERHQLFVKIRDEALKQIKLKNQTSSESS